MITLKALQQGSSKLVLEGQYTAEFRSNPDQTHLPMIFLKILKMLLACTGVFEQGRTKLFKKVDLLGQIWGSLHYSENKIKYMNKAIHYLCFLFFLLFSNIKWYSNIQRQYSQQQLNSRK